MRGVRAAITHLRSRRINQPNSNKTIYLYIHPTCVRKTSEFSFRPFTYSKCISSIYTMYPHADNVISFRLCFAYAYVFMSGVARLALCARTAPTMECPYIFGGHQCSTLKPIMRQALNVHYLSDISLANKSGTATIEQKRVSARTPRALYRKPSV